MKSPSGGKRRASGSRAVSEERIAGARKRTLGHHRSGGEESLGCLASFERSVLGTGETINMSPSILPRRKNSSLATNSNRIVANLARETGPGTEMTTTGNVQSITRGRGCNGMKVRGLMPCRPDGVIAVSEMTRELKDTLPNVLCPIIRKEDGFQGGKLTRHPITKAKTMSLLVMYKLDHLGDEAGVKRG